MTMSPDAVQALEQARAAEKRQALFYRALAAEAEERGDEPMAQRFHELHADEQHHLSRITARLVEVGHNPADLAGLRADAPELDQWEQRTRDAESAEVQRYERLLDELELDEQTRALLDEILAVERQHLEQLGGKWTMA